VGCQTLQALHTSQIFVETFGNAEAAAEGANLGLWANQSFRTRTKADIVPQIHMYTERGVAPDTRGWKIGAYKAEAQNLARTLMEAPANHMTPTMFAQQVVQILCQSGVNVEVKVRGWAESQGMEPFLTVARGSCEPPIFLELSYYGTDYSERPIVLIGQGNTYDSGGICLKTYKQLNDMRGDMAGAAVIVATCKAISALKLPINVRGLIPLCENMIGCNAFKPGDVIKAKNGMTIEVESTDNEEPIVMVDALLYAKNFWPKCIIDVGTMHPDLITALGTAASGVFTNSEQMWQGIKHASVHTGDRVWKFPLWNYFTEQITSANTADVQNVGSGEGGGACKAAAFLREFIACGPWMHIVSNGRLET
jgi:cytosol aminopeptidase